MIMHLFYSYIIPCHYVLKHVNVFLVLFQCFHLKITIVKPVVRELVGSNATASGNEIKSSLTIEPITLTHRIETSPLHDSERTLPLPSSMQIMLGHCIMTSNWTFSRMMMSQYATPVITDQIHVT